MTPTELLAAARRWLEGKGKRPTVIVCEEKGPRHIWMCAVAPVEHCLPRAIFWGLGDGLRLLGDIHIGEYDSELAAWGAACDAVVKCWEGCGAVEMMDRIERLEALARDFRGQVKFRHSEHVRLDDVCLSAKDWNRLREGFKAALEDRRHE